jgi:tetraacyldisaccharide 4'-kinase
VYRRVVHDRIRIAVARRLEAGAWRGPLARASARAWAAVATRTLVRPLFVPSGVRAITIGGATLGGSGKTRVAVACARELHALGARVALVGHAYRATPRRARVVSVHDSIALVGDEALACARELAGLAVVVVGPSRQAAVDHAASIADYVVIDGPLQIAPRASLSILAVDEGEPWGSGRLPPAGDLRAPREALLAHADHVVHVDAQPSELPITMGRFALFTALARPHRLVRGLARRGLAPLAIVSVPDHGPASSAASRIEETEAGIDFWLATTKCALHLESLAPRRPIHTIPASIALPGPLLGSLRELVRSGKTIVPAPTYAP